MPPLFNISDYLDLSKFKIYKSTSLFEPSKEDLIAALSKKKCPLCGLKLYPTYDKKIYRCKSVKKDGFVIRGEVLSKFLSTG